MEDIDAATIQLLLQDTIASLLNTDDISSDLQMALICRLRFRATFLKTVETADSRTSTETASLWLESLAFVPEMKSSTRFGRAVPTAFSSKLQRKLASTVPPRPIIHVSQEVAFKHLERLCQHGSMVLEVLKYHNSHSLLVRLTCTHC